jgi:transposase-like protein
MNGDGYPFDGDFVRKLLEQSRIVAAELDAAREAKRRPPPPCPRCVSVATQRTNGTRYNTVCEACGFAWWRRVRGTRRG